MIYVSLILDDLDFISIYIIWVNREKYSQQLFSERKYIIRRLKVNNFNEYINSVANIVH